MSWASISATVRHPALVVSVTRTRSSPPRITDDLSELSVDRCNSSGARERSTVSIVSGASAIACFGSVPLPRNMSKSVTAASTVADRTATDGYQNMLATPGGVLRVQASFANLRGEHVESSSATRLLPILTPALRARARLPAAPQPLRPSTRSCRIGPLRLEEPRERCAGWPPSPARARTPTHSHH